ncbi:hypothetical protein PR202_gb25360 [Eleusine coracana subsp. coracana]|uniref:Uncharacterized protein n=1 Tax=Eleusine coracana subsp. coracana TaxID=191504 RepID=A0AAV5FNX0_ELECO|nr:hypothetical protein PR202_gb25316 [Eleusine coracana subsp. coracana]GJN36497.1 hypothetical protein PR202_gb25360 [Eleusine coracana subsp. coracana]
MGLLRRCKKLLFHHSAAAVDPAAHDGTRLSPEEFERMTAPLAELLPTMTDEAEAAAVRGLLDHVTAWWGPPGARPPQPPRKEPPHRWWTDERTRPSREEFVRFTAPIARMLMNADDDDPEKDELCRLLDHLINQWKGGATPSERLRLRTKRSYATVSEADAAIQSAVADGGDLSRLSRDEFLSLTAPLAEMLRHAADDDDPETKEICRLLDRLIKQWRSGRR